MKVLTHSLLQRPVHFRIIASVLVDQVPRFIQYTAPFLLNDQYGLGQEIGLMIWTWRNNYTGQILALRQAKRHVGLSTFKYNSTNHNCLQWVFLPHDISASTSRDNPHAPSLLFLGHGGQDSGQDTLKLQERCIVNCLIGTLLRHNVHCTDTRSGVCTV